MFAWMYGTFWNTPRPRSLGVCRLDSGGSVPFRSVPPINKNKKMGTPSLLHPKPKEVLPSSPRHATPSTNPWSAASTTSCYCSAPSPAGRRRPPPRECATPPPSPPPAKVHHMHHHSSEAGSSGGSGLAQEILILYVSVVTIYHVWSPRPRAWVITRLIRAVSIYVSFCLWIVMMFRRRVLAVAPAAAWPWRRRCRPRQGHPHLLPAGAGAGAGCRARATTLRLRQGPFGRLRRDRLSRRRPRQHHWLSLPWPAANHHRCLAWARSSSSSSGRKS